MVSCVCVCVKRDSGTAYRRIESKPVVYPPPSRVQVSCFYSGSFPHWSACEPFSSLPQRDAPPNKGPLSSCFVVCPALAYRIPLLLGHPTCTVRSRPYLALLAGGARSEGSPFFAPLLNHVLCTRQSCSCMFICGILRPTMVMVQTLGAIFAIE